MNTNPFDCTGTPFNFQPDVLLGARAEHHPWGIGPYMINNQFEIGHFEPCTRSRGSATTSGQLQRHLLHPVPRPVRDGEGHLARVRARRLTVLQGRRHPRRYRRRRTS